MSRRLLFLILAFSALVVLCLSCFGLNRLAAPPLRLRLDLQAPSLDQIRNRLTVKIKGSELRLRQGDGCSASGSQVVVPIHTTCEFGIPISASSTRQLVLLAGASGGKVSLHLAQPKYLSLDQSLAGGDAPARLDIYRNPNRGEATFILTDCQPAKSASIQLDRCFFDIGK
ncbi:MAG TPA: hypothetical protein VF498_07985 [Anaerolineales bacterium]